MSKHFFSIGDLVWIKDEVHCVEAPKPTSSIMFVSALKSQGLGKDVLAVHPKHVEPLITTQFSVGQKVKSYHTFIGEVTGFEADTNRVVCRSQYDEPDGSRKRYAYRGCELEGVTIKPYGQHTCTKDTTDKETKNRPGRYIMTTREGDSFLVNVQSFVQNGVTLYRVLEDDGDHCILLIDSIDDPEILRRVGVLKLFKV